MADYSTQYQYFATDSENSSINKLPLYKIRNSTQDPFFLDFNLKKWFHDDVYLWKISENSIHPTNEYRPELALNGEAVVGNSLLPMSIWTQSLVRRQERKSETIVNCTEDEPKEPNEQLHNAINPYYMFDESIDSDNTKPIASNRQFMENHLFERIDFYHLIQANSQSQGKKYKKYTTRYEILIDPEHIVLYQISKRLIGAKGCNMKRINSNTGAKLRLRGIGSGYYEGNSRKEARERLHLCVSAPSNVAFAKTCDMVESLLEEVAEHYRKLLSGDVEFRDDTT